MPRLIDADSLKLAFIGKRYETQAIEYVIDQQPTVDAEPVRHGHWIETHEVLDYIKCSECGEDWCTEANDTETFNYCPNCGAKMDEVEENE